MCTAVGGGSQAARVGRSARSGLGRANRREVQTRSMQSVFQAGTYNINNIRRIGTRGNAYKSFHSRSGFRGDRTRNVRIGSQEQYNQILNEQIQVRRDGGWLRKRQTGKRWYADGSTQRTSADFKRKSSGSTFKNEERANSQNRVKVNDENSARRKTRGARVGQRKEVGYRSRRKGAAQATNGLRIGGSGVSVPGS